MRYNKVDLLYQHALKSITIYYHHAENDQKSILQYITPFGLRLKKEAAINPISFDVNNQWNGIFKDVEQKLLALLLKEVQKISKSADSEFQESIKKEHPSNYVKEKELVENRNFKLKRLLEERRKKKWHKFRNLASAPEKRTDKNPLLPD